MLLQDGVEEEGGPNWRGGGSTASGRRWNAPHGNAPPVAGEGRGGGWRSTGGGDEFRNKYGDRDFVNGGQKEWRDDYTGGRRGYHNSSSSSLAKYGRRPRNDSENLPEWASEETYPLDNRGGTFDSAGKFQSVEKSPKQNSSGINIIKTFLP